MAKHNHLVSVLALLVAGYTAALAASATATTFIVGDDQGWTMTGVDYTAWVKGKAFAIGDKLVFKYPSEEHTVAEVGKTDYFACAGGNALSNDRSGCTNITLAAPGTRYFICDIPGHCTAGMRLAVTVAGAGAGDGDGGGAPSPPGATPTGGAAGSSMVRPAMGSSFIVKAIAWAMIKLALS